MLEAILQTRVANPLVVVDEIEKAGDIGLRHGLSFGLTNALLPLLERSTASSWSCPYFRVRFDMSWIGWVMTANGTRGLPAPFFSRCPPMRLPALTRGHLMGFARAEAARRGLPEAMASTVVEAIEAAPDRHVPSLRTAVRMIDSAERAAKGPVLH